MLKNVDLVLGVVGSGVGAVERGDEAQLQAVPGRLDGGHHLHNRFDPLYCLKQNISIKGPVLRNGLGF